MLRTHIFPGRFFEIGISSKKNTGWNTVHVAYASGSLHYEHTQAYKQHTVSPFQQTKKTGDIQSVLD